MYLNFLSNSLASLKHLNFVTIKAKCSQTGRTADLSLRGIKANKISLPAQSTIMQSLQQFEEK